MNGDSTSFAFLIDATQIRDLHSGVAQRLIQLWQGFRPEEFSHRFGLVAYQSMADELLDHFPDFQFHLIDDPGTGPFKRVRNLNPQLREILNQGNYDLIFQDGPIPCSKRSIPTIHDLRMLDPDTVKFWKRVGVAAVLASHLEKVPAVFTVSQTVKAEITRQLKVPSARIHVIANGVTAHAPADDDNTILDSLSLQAGGYRLFVGHLEQRKNIDFLIRLQRELLGTSQAKKLVIACHRRTDQDEFPLTSDEAKELEIVLCDSANHSQLQSLYRHAALYLLPSLIEGFSMTPLEALAAKTLALVSDIPAHREILGSEFCALLEVDLWRQKIAELEAMAEGSPLHKRAEELVEKFSWGSAQAQLAEFFSSKLVT